MIVIGCYAVEYIGDFSEQVSYLSCNGGLPSHFNNGSILGIYSNGNVAKTARWFGCENLI